MRGRIALPKHFVQIEQGLPRFAKAFRVRTRPRVAFALAM